MSEEIKETIVAAPIVEAPAAEPLSTEVKAEGTEILKEEPKVAPQTEVLQEKKENSKIESLSQEIKETKEELAVIKEVRNELAVTYRENQDLHTKVEHLSKSIEGLESEKKVLSEQLSGYKQAEEKLLAKKKAERLESLSNKFKLLGQDKSIEQLSVKDDETLAEFEKIVDAALDKSADTKVMPSVTAPSQAASEKLTEDNGESEEEELSVKQNMPRKVDFFGVLAKEIRNEQNKTGRTIRHF